MNVTYITYLRIFLVIKWTDEDNANNQVKLFSIRNYNGIIN